MSIALCAGYDVGCCWTGVVGARFAWRSVVCRLLVLSGCVWGDFGTGNGYLGTVSPIDIDKHHYHHQALGVVDRKDVAPVGICEKRLTARECRAWACGTGL